MLPVISYKLVREATPRIVVVLRAEVLLVLLVSVARPKYVHEAVFTVIRSYVLILCRDTVAILKSIALHLTARSTIVQAAMPTRRPTAQALRMMYVANLEAYNMVAWEFASVSNLRPLPLPTMTDHISILSRLWPSSKLAMLMRLSSSLVTTLEKAPLTRNGQV
jgi:hypothetical protein